MNNRDDLMDDEQLLRDLASAARDLEEEERERLDARWEALAAGALSAEEREALRARDPEAFELFRPLDERFREAAAARIGRELAEGPKAPKPASRTPLPFPRRGRRFLPWMATAAAALITAAAFLLWPGGGPEPLAAYSSTLTGGVEELRGPADPAAGGGPRRLVDGISLRWVLTPASATGAVEVRTFLRRGEELRAWPAPVEVASSGAISVAGTVAEGLDLPAGASTLLAVVARAGTMPDEALLRITLDQALSGSDAELAGCSALAEGLWLCSAPVRYQPSG